MSTTREYEHLISLKNFSSSDYWSVYADEDNNVFFLTHPTPYSEDTLESDMTYDGVLDTTGYDILETMERKNGKICD